jgi:ubiquinone/menaquinone biosynthesis C-methylase UbiE
VPGEVARYYARGLEAGRLAAGAGRLELVRTQDVLRRALPPPPATVADVGGGPGVYARWLAELGYDVHLLDPVPLHLDQARVLAARAPGVTLGGVHLADARALPLPDAGADAVLLLGPLYHLPDRADRLRALAEARRVVRQGGVVVAAAISRFASTIDGMRGSYLEDPAFAAIAARDRADGQHRNPTDDANYFTTAYFHRPEELVDELASVGLALERLVGVEGPGWLLADLEPRLADDGRRAVLLEALAALEAEPSLLGVSAHLLAVARKA